MMVPFAGSIPAPRLKLLNSYLRKSVGPKLIYGTIADGHDIRR